MSIRALLLFSSATAPWWEIVGTAADLWGLVYIGIAQISSPFAWLRKVSQHPLLALRMALLSAFLASLTAAWPALPPLIHLMIWPSWRRSLFISLLGPGADGNSSDVLIKDTRQGGLNPIDLLLEPLWCRVVVGDQSLACLKPSCHQQLGLRIWPILLFPLPSTDTQMDDAEANGHQPEPAARPPTPAPAYNPADMASVL